MARDSGDSSSSEASFRGRSRDSSASSSRAAGTKSGAEDSSSGEEDDSGSEEEDSNSEADRQKLEKAQKKVSVRLAGLIKAQKEMKDAAKEIEQEIQTQMVNKKKMDELKKVAAARAKEEAADKRAAEAAAADRQREQREERQREQREERQREQREEQQREQREEEQREQREEERRRERETRKRSEDDRGTKKRPEAGRAEAGDREASWEGRHVRDRRVQDRLGKRKEERPGRPSGPEGAGLEPGYTIPRKSRPWKTTTTHRRSLPSSYEGYAIALPRGEKEKLVFQQLLDRKMLFRAPGAGPDRCREPHFWFRAGEPILSSERIDRRRNRSPEGQEVARKRHRNLKN
jgi:hypothetical protein